MIAQNIFLKNSTLFIIGIFLFIPLFLFAQGWDGSTQQVWDPTTNTFVTVPASWGVDPNASWDSTQNVFNPATNSWIQVPAQWSIGEALSTTQQVWDPTANAFITVPASWNVSAGNWASLQSIFNPVTNTWIQVPLTWTVPPSTTADSEDWVTPTVAWQVPGASSDPLNPNVIQTGTPTIGVPITDNNKTVGSILRLATTIIQTLLPVLLGLSTVIFMISIIAMIKDSDNEEKRTQAKKVMIQSIFALFILISAWGLVAVLSGTFGFEFGLPQLSA